MKNKTSNSCELFSLANELRRAILDHQEDKALRVGAEFWRGGFGLYAWRVLESIATEDVTIDNWEVLANFIALRSVAERRTKQVSQARQGQICLARAIILLSRVEKTEYIRQKLDEFFAEAKNE